MEDMLSLVYKLEGKNGSFTEIYYNVPAGSLEHEQEVQAWGQLETWEVIHLRADGSRNDGVPSGYTPVCTKLTVIK